MSDARRKRAELNQRLASPTLWLAGLAGLLLHLMAPSVLHAQNYRNQARDSSWEQLTVEGPVRRLFAPTSGALLADSAQGLVRSDDAGDTWRKVSLGPVLRIAAVDPRNHDAPFGFGVDGRNLYVAGQQGVWRWRSGQPAAPQVETD